MALANKKRRKVMKYQVVRVPNSDLSKKATPWKCPKWIDSKKPATKKGGK